MSNIQNSGKYFLCKINTLCGGNKRIPRRLLKGKINFQSNFYYETNIEKLWEQNKDVHHQLIFKQHVTMNGGRKYGVKCIN